MTKKRSRRQASLPNYSKTGANFFAVSAVLILFVILWIAFKQGGLGYLLKG